MKKISALVLVASLSAFAVMQTATAPLVYAEGAAKGDEGGQGKKKPDDVTGGRFTGDPIYVHIAPLVLPIIGGDGVEQLVTLSFDVQVKDFDTADDMHTNMPRVMDALMRALYGGLDKGTLRNGKLANVTKIRDKATAAVSEVVGKNKIIDVLVQGVSQRML